MNKCSFCGFEFNETESTASCSGCPMSKTCNKSKCPNCGYEILKEPGIIRFLRKFKKK